MLEKKKRRLDSSIKSKILEEIHANTTKEKNDITADDVLYHLFGDYECGRFCDYTFYRYAEPSKKSFWQRFNICWVYPLFLITIPYQWLVNGEIGVNKNTKIGKVIDYLVKFN